MMSQVGRICGIIVDDIRKRRPPNIASIFPSRDHRWQPMCSDVNASPASPVDRRAGSARDYVDPMRKRPGLRSHDRPATRRAKPNPARVAARESLRTAPGPSIGATAMPRPPVPRKCRLPTVHRRHMPKPNLRWPTSRSAKTGARAPPPGGTRNGIGRPFPEP